jgi:hypothetical protein
VRETRTERLARGGVQHGAPSRRMRGCGEREPRRARRCCGTAQRLASTGAACASAQEGDQRIAREAPPAGFHLVPHS